ncbi:MAG: hypothetical protein QOE36_1065 [Gaiellaceae bacterium]|jgi:hypothetical protein|nr:hypothetical protein [Gaiellaceae bacterium]
MATKRQTTMAKMTRERKVQEKRQLKAEKKLERKAAAEAEANGETPGIDAEAVIADLNERPDLNARNV